MARLEHTDSRSQRAPILQTGGQTVAVASRAPMASLAGVQGAYCRSSINTTLLRESPRANYGQVFHQLHDFVLLDLEDGLLCCVDTGRVFEARRNDLAEGSKCR